MAFLDNSGDIILDAVLTDTGRLRMAKGNFNIAKFAFGDEEINYALFNSSHPSGSAFYDLEVMQTPILEPSTNNVSSMHSKLVTIGRTNMLFMPVIRLNYSFGLDGAGPRGGADKADYGSLSAPWYDGESITGRISRDRDAVIAAGTTYTGGGQFFAVTADTTTEERMHWGSAYGSQDPEDRRAGPSSNTGGFTGWSQRGVMLGSDHNFGQCNTGIVLDQGIISGGDPSRWQDIPEDLKETQWIIQIDHRLGRITSQTKMASFRFNNATSQWGFQQRVGPNQVQPYSFVDDDNIATYFFGAGADQNMGSEASVSRPSANAEQRTIDGWSKNLVPTMKGPLGRRFYFGIKASLSLQQSDALWDLLGTTSSNTLTWYNCPAGDRLKSTKVDASKGENDVKLRFIDTTVRVTGVTTGYHVDIPIKFVKYDSMVK